MSDGVYIMLDEIRGLKQQVAALETKLRIIDDNVDEILMLQSNESMREVALFIKDVIRK